MVFMKTCRFRNILFSHHSLLADVFDALTRWNLDSTGTTWLLLRPQRVLIHVCCEWCEQLCSGEGTKSNITCTCFELGMDVKAELMCLFISHKCLLLGIHNWHLLARQSWQLLHWALNTSADSCTCVCSFARCNPCFVFFQVSELLDLKLFFFETLLESTQNFHGFFTLSCSQRPFMIPRGNLG